MVKTLIVGYFGYHNDQLDGQTVKTRSIYKLLDGEELIAVRVFDTQVLRRNPLRIFQMFWQAVRCDKLIHIPAHNNLRILFPIFYFLSKIFRYDVLIIVVGGWLVEYIEPWKLHRILLARVKGVFPQTLLMKRQLEEAYKFENVEVLPNFRLGKKSNVIKGASPKVFRVVFFARINELKGLDYMEYLSRYIEKNYKKGSVEIDYYGPIDGKSDSYFRHNVLDFSFASYGGVLDPKDVCSVIGSYDVLILPTHYYTEGFPGSVLDAYRSSIPVIVTNWKHAHEFVDDEETGFIIPFESGETDLCKKVNLLFQDPYLLREMKLKAFAKSAQYSPEAARKVLMPYII